MTLRYVSHLERYRAKEHTSQCQLVNFRLILLIFSHFDDLYTCSESAIHRLRDVYVLEVGTATRFGGRGTILEKVSAIFI
jgi:hypothetical protein